MNTLVGKCQISNYILSMMSGLLRNKTIAVLGYGSQGRAFALNLRDSGYGVIVGLKPKSKSRLKAKKDGFKVIATVMQAVKKSDVVIFALPDHLHGKIFEQYVEKDLKAQSALVFLHGLSIHFGFIKPPDDCDVIMIAPHAPGLAVREKYLKDRSVSAFYGVYRDYSGQAKKIAVELAGGLGFERKRLIQSSFEHEAIGDLFGEQAVLCGGLAELIKNGFEVLVEKGIPPENAYLEVAYQLDLIVALIKQYGIEGMLKRISVAARFGAVETGPKIINKDVKNRMKKAADDIISGKFPEKLNKLRQADLKRLNKAIKRLTNPEFEKVARNYSG